MNVPLSHLVISPSLKPKFSKSGWALLLLLILLTGLSILLLYWYQNEIRYRMQAEAALQFQRVYHQVEGVLAQSILLLQNYSESQLRSDSVTSALSEFNSFIPGWLIQSKPAKDAPFLKLKLQNQSSKEPVTFEALFRFHSYYLSDIPWFDLTFQPQQNLPTNLIFPREQDQFLSSQVPRFSLLPETTLISFDYVFQGETRIVWNLDHLIIFQGEHFWDLTNFSKERLSIQIQGNTSIEGAMGFYQGKQIFFQIIGNLNLALLPSATEGFSSTLPRLFVHVTERMNLPAPTSKGAILQIAGYFWIENSCPVLSSFLHAVYWKGSLACPMNSSIQSNVPLHFLYSPPRHHPPDSFARTSLQFNGIRLLQ